MTNRSRAVDPRTKIFEKGFAQELEKIQSNASEFILYRAVVVDVLNDVALRTPAEMDALRTHLGIATTKEVLEDDADDAPENEEAVEKFEFSQTELQSILMSAPRNTIVTRIITDGWDKRSTGEGILCYPFFPPHLAFPVKAGEQVWIINEAANMKFPIGYWVARIPEPLHVDDVNYTHGDRKFAPTQAISLADKAEGKSAEFVPPFNNGADGNFRTLFQPGDVNPYEMIYTGSIANKSFTMEPVPRFTKRPGDLVLQGSNNTMVCLGEDRGYTADAPPPPSPADAKKSNASDTDGEANERAFAGTIDVVAGRGMPQPATPEEKPKLTAPRIITNTREKTETGKNPQLEDPDKVQFDRLYNPAEGDPDFINDMSRVYVSMKTSGDKNLGLQYPAYADMVVDPAPYVVVKSDEIRIVGRQEGSVRIVKEGEVGDDQCVITMLADGTVAIDAKKIYIGDGRDKQVFLGTTSDGQPVFRGNDLKDALDSLADFLSGFIGNMGRPLVGAAVDMPKFKAAVKAALSGVSFTK
jgi:hypothetical protein